MKTTVHHVRRSGFVGRSDSNHTTVLDWPAERREEHPRIFARIHLEHAVRGKGIESHALERAIRLSEEK